MRVVRRIRIADNGVRITDESDSNTPSRHVARLFLVRGWDPVDTVRAEVAAAASATARRRWGIYVTAIVGATARERFMSTPTETTDDTVWSPMGSLAIGLPELVGYG